MAEESKVCKTCGLDRPLSDYTKNDQYKDGLERSCRYCRSDKQREQRAAHPQMTKERDRANYLKNREKRLQQDRARHRRNREAARAERLKEQGKTTWTIWTPEENPSQN